MKNHIIRIGSVVKNGIGGPDAGQLDIIYTYLLQEFHQDYYSHIQINQIGDDLEEFVKKDKGNTIRINIKSPVYDDFYSKTDRERNLIRLGVVHEALLRIARYEGKLDCSLLELIKESIIKNEFHFEITYKSVVNKKDRGRVGKVVIEPKPGFYIVSVIIEDNALVRCKMPLLIGLPTYYYLDDFFSSCKWNDKSELIITGKRKEIEIRVLAEGCRYIIRNLSLFDRAPFWEMMKVNVTEKENKDIYENWLGSLHPAVAAIVRQEYN